MTKESAKHPLDRDGDGAPGGSLPAAERLPADLLAKAKKVGVAVDHRWGADTLKEKIAAADTMASAMPMALPGFIVLLGDRGPHLAGKVLRADADLIAALDVEHVKWRAASPRDVSLAGLA